MITTEKNLVRYAVFSISLLVKIFGCYHALLETSYLREDAIERQYIKHRKREKNAPFQDQYRRITGCAFTRKYGGVTERFPSVKGRNCLVYPSNTAVNGPVTDDVLVDLG